MSRQRLTKRMAADDNTPFPGTVGNEDRKDPKSDQYHTFKQQVNHELPDMRTEWKDNQRDEIGFGVPKIAKLYATAHKATRLAVLFLGDKCTDKVIEAQARDFMRLGSARIDVALKRFAETEEMYAEDAALEGEEIQKVSPATEKAQQVVAADVAPVAPVVAPVEAPVVAAVEAPIAPVATPVVATTVVEAPKVAEVKVEAPKVAEDKKEEVKEECKDASEASPVLEVKAEDEVVEDEEDKEAEEDTSDIDVELTSEDVTPDEDVEEDAELASVFEDDDITEGEDDEEVTDEPKTAKKAKAGIKHLGGQPTATRVASADDLVSLWQSAPDVSDVFK